MENKNEGIFSNLTSEEQKIVMEMLDLLKESLDE